MSCDNMKLRAFYLLYLARILNCDIFYLS
jgi:hypothetical protein